MQNLGFIPDLLKPSHQEQGLGIKSPQELWCSTKNLRQEMRLVKPGLLAHSVALTPQKNLAKEG